MLRLPQRFVNGRISRPFFNHSASRLLAFFLLSAGAISLYPTSSAAAQSFYVSSNFGNDSWSGLLPAPNSAGNDGPFRTVGRAQIGMQSSSVKTSYLRSGTYYINGSLSLSGADNGETWISYPGETAAFDGGGSGRIQVNNAQGITFQQVTIQGFSAGGLFLNYVDSVTVKWVTFLNCYQNCINGNAVTNSTFDSNTMNGQSPGNPPGNVNTGYSAIAMQYGSANNRITHNLIENCQGGGISFADGPNDPRNNNNIIDRNIFRNIDTNIVDGGAIYMNDASRTASGNQITNNVIDGNTGSGYWTKAFYLDDGMSNVLVSGNTCRSCGQWAWQIHVGNNNVIINNVFDLSAGGLLGIYQTSPSGVDGNMTGNVFAYNIVYFAGAAPSSLYQVNVNPNDSLPSTHNNLYYSANGSYVPNGSTIVDYSPAYGDPQFASPGSGNYTLASTSAAYSLIGFQTLPTDQGPLPQATATTSGGSLSGSGVSSNATVNLTAEGSIDWAHWGATSLTRKQGVSPLISNYSVVGSTSALYYTNDPRAVTFSDGTVPNAATVTDGIYANGLNGLSFTAPADTNQHTLTVHVGGYYSGGTLRAHLSDGSAADFTDTTGVVSGQYDRNYTLTYNAASGGQTITVSWICNSANGNVTLNGAALR